MLRGKSRYLSTCRVLITLSTKKYFYMNIFIILSLYGYRNVPNLTRHMICNSVHNIFHKITVKKQMFRKERDLFLQMIATNFEAV